MFFPPRWVVTSMKRKRKKQFASLIYAKWKLIASFFYVLWIFFSSYVGGSMTDGRIRKQTPPGWQFAKRGRNVPHWVLYHFFVLFPFLFQWCQFHRPLLQLNTWRTPSSFLLKFQFYQKRCIPPDRMIRASPMMNSSYGIKLIGNLIIHYSVTYEVQLF